MEIHFTKEAKEDLNYWKKHDIKIYNRIKILIEAIQNNPYTGIGKPEALKFKFSGYWSRRINQEHRIIYKIYEEYLYIIQLRHHYKN